MSTSRRLNGFANRCQTNSTPRSRAADVPAELPLYETAPPVYRAVRAVPPATDLPLHQSVSGQSDFLGAALACVSVPLVAAVLVSVGLSRRAGPRWERKLR